MNNTTPNLSSTAFRVYDKQEKRYLDPKGFVTDGTGWLFIKQETSLHFADPDRYVVERFTGCYDLNKRPIYVGDAVYFLRYDAGADMERIRYRERHPGISQDELNAAVPRCADHLIRGVIEGRTSDFDLECLSKNDSMWLGHKDFRKYRHGYRIVGNVHEPYADVTARVPEYRDYLAGTEIDQNKVNERGNG